VIHSPLEGWERTDHHWFMKLRDEFAYQSHQRMGLLCERFRMSSKKYTKEDIQVSTFYSAFDLYS
jgi:hypothetical protein